MANFFKEFLLAKNYWAFFRERRKIAIYLGILSLGVFFLIAFFDKGLAMGLILLVFLTSVTFLITVTLGIQDKKIYSLFIIAILIHSAAALFIYFTGFNPTGGGADYILYHNTAVEVADRFSQGNFSLEGLYANHYFPVIIGILYMITLPEMIVGQLFAVWLSVISILLLYLLVLEIGGSKKSAFLTGLIVAFYPNYLYFGSLLLKDIMVIPLVLLGLLLIVKMLKSFNGLKFLAFFIILTSLMHFRFYVGLALMFSFIICWFIIANAKGGEKVIYGLTIIFLLGFSPQLLGFGYYGIKPLQSYLNRDIIKVYREVVYAPSPEFKTPNIIADTAIKEEVIGDALPPCPLDLCLGQSSLAKNDSHNSGNVQDLRADTVTYSDSHNNINPQNMNGSTITQKEPPLQEGPQKNIQNNVNEDEDICAQCAKITETKIAKIKETNSDSGVGSSFVVSAGFDSPFTFIKNYFTSFIYSLFGPFPWQLRYKRHLLFLLETIPWYLFWIVGFYQAFKLIAIKGFAQFFKTYKFSLPLLLFGALALGALSLYINNFGIIARIRIPIFIVLLCVLSLSLNLEQGYFKKITPAFKKYIWKSI